MRSFESNGAAVHADVGLEGRQNDPSTPKDVSLDATVWHVHPFPHVSHVDGVLRLHGTGSDPHAILVSSKGMDWTSEVQFDEVGSTQDGVRVCRR